VYVFLALLPSFSSAAWRISGHRNGIASPEKENQAKEALCLFVLGSLSSLVCFTALQGGSTIGKERLPCGRRTNIEIKTKKRESFERGEQKKKKMPPQHRSFCVAYGKKKRRRIHFFGKKKRNRCYFMHVCLFFIAVSIGRELRESRYAVYLIRSLSARIDTSVYSCSVLDRQPSHI
jgi:hypothetical protein